MAGRTVKNMSAAELAKMSPSVRAKAERQIEKAKKCGTYTTPTQKRCTVDPRYICNPERCPPLRVKIGRCND